MMVAGHQTYPAQVLDVWIDNNDGRNESTPHVCIEAQIQDEELCATDAHGGKVLLSMTPWDFQHPPGTDIKNNMYELARAFQLYIGKTINVSCPKSSKKDKGPSLLSKEDRDIYNKQHQEVEEEDYKESGDDKVDISSEQIVDHVKNIKRLKK